jgi:hypothetical protein
MNKPYNFVLVCLFVVIIIGFSGCDRKDSGNNATDETQATQETQASQATEESSSVEPSTAFEVKQDVTKNIVGVKGALKANRTLIVKPVKLQEVVVTEELQLSIDFLRKDYKDFASIVADYPDLLSTKVEEYGHVRYSLSDTLKLSVNGENTIALESQAFQTLLSDVKTLPDLNLMHVADHIVLLNEQGKIRRAYKCNNYYKDIYYGDFLGNDAPELAFVYNDLDIHFFNLSGDVLEPIVLNDLYHEIDTQTQAILNNRNFEVILRTNPNSAVTSIEETYASVLPEKLYLNIENGTHTDSPVFKEISTVIDRETMRAVLSCRWMWTNGLVGDITLAEVKYAFSDRDIKRAIQQNVDVRYSDPNLVNRAFEQSEVIIKQNGNTLLDATAAMDEQVRFFDLEKPFVIPEATGNLEGTHHYFERSGLSLDISYTDDMLVFYTLKLSNPDYTLGDAFKVGMSQDALKTAIGVPDLVNSNMLSGPTEWSYYVKNETGDRLLNFYYGFMKVVFVFEKDRVLEIRVEIFASPI